ncbi:hypothetical protein PG984_006496 [Apiospora sp. TS-2023a]
MPPSFLDLPRELRDEVYKELFLIEDHVRLFIREHPCHTVDCYETTDDEDEDEEDYDDSDDEDDDDDEEEEDDDVEGNICDDGDGDDDGDGEYPDEIVWSSDSSDDDEPDAPSLPRRPIEDAHPKKGISTLKGSPALLDELYSLVLVTESRVMRSSTSSTKESYEHKNALLEVNRQVSEEACEYLYTHTRFVVSPDYRLCGKYLPVYPFCGGEALRQADGVCVLNTFFDTIGPVNAQWVRHFWFSPRGLLDWELLGMCIALHDRCPDLRTLKLSQGLFLDPENALSQFDIVSILKPVGIYFENGLGDDPEQLAEFYNQVAKMFGLDRILH